MQASGGQGVEVRRAGPRDALALMTLRASWRDTVVTEAFTSEFVAWFEREGSHRWWWLAEDPAGVAIGMVNLKVVERMPSPGRSSGRWGYLANLFVHPAHRGEGLGAQLVASLLAASREEGLVRVVLSPRRATEPAIRTARCGRTVSRCVALWSRCWQELADRAAPAVGIEKDEAQANPPLAARLGPAAAVRPAGRTQSCQAEGHQVERGQRRL